MVVAGQHEKTTSDNVNVTGGLRQIVLVDDVKLVGKAISLRNYYARKPICGFTSRSYTDYAARNHREGVSQFLKKKRSKLDALSFRCSR